MGAATSILSGYLGMWIATYANARTALEARKGIAPAFMAGARASLHTRRWLFLCLACAPCLRAFLGFRWAAMWCGQLHAGVDYVGGEEGWIARELGVARQRRACCSAILAAGTHATRVRVCPAPQML